MLTSSDATIGHLEQLIELAARYDDPAWTHPQAIFNGSTCGQHVRHTLDHIERLLEGIPKGIIDYDARKRDPEIESSTDAASSRCKTLIESIDAITHHYPYDHVVHVCSSCSETDEASQDSSTVGREFQFLVSHNVHHFAIIGAISKSLSIETPENFGTAPSTIKYRQMVTPT